MQKSIIALLTFAICFSLGCTKPKPKKILPTTPSPQHSAKAKALMQTIFQANMPPSAINHRYWSGTFMTTIMNGKFECTASDLDKFLAESKLLPDQLNPEEGNNFKSQLNSSWFYPDNLKNRVGLNCDWDAESIASCSLTAGKKSDQDELITVYFSIVFESRKATGLRPEIKMVPNWKPKTTATTPTLKSNPSSP